MENILGEPSRLLSWENWGCWWWETLFFMGLEFMHVDGGKGQMKCTWAGAV